MNNQIYFPTEGVLTIEMPGRGMRTQRVSKNVTKRWGKTNFIATATNLSDHAEELGHNQTNNRAIIRPATGRDFEFQPKVCHMIVHISQDTANHWAEKMVKNFHDRSIEKKYKTPESRFTYWLNDHVSHLCEQAMIRPDRCTFTFKPSI